MAFEDSDLSFDTSTQKKTASGREYQKFLREKGRKESSLVPDSATISKFEERFPKPKRDSKKVGGKGGKFRNKDSKLPKIKSSKKKMNPKRDSLEELTYSNKIQINPDMQTSIDDMKISDKTKSALRNKGFLKLTPVQSQSYSQIFSGADCIVRSKTGTGKTLAFGIPLIEKLINLQNDSKYVKGTSPSILILEPTRELVVQVAQELSSICRIHGLKVTTIYGGVSTEQQVNALQAGVDIVVATPGRALDHITRKSLDLSTISHVVLDEGDTMLEMGFQKHVEVILANVKYPGELARQAAEKSLKDDDENNDDDEDDMESSVSFDANSIISSKTSKNRQGQVQMLLFSATVAGWICKLTDKHMTNPIFLDSVKQGETRLPKTITHYSMQFPETGPAAKSRMKATVLCVQDAVLHHSGGGQVIVFTDTKLEADGLLKSPALEGFRPQTLHGGMTQRARQSTIRQFKEGKIDLLLATDIASRGIDVDGVDLVIHSQPPDNLDSYVHRSGRTGRVGRAGSSIVLHNSSQKELDKLSNFEKSLNFQFSRLTPSDPSESNSISNSINNNSDSDSGDIDSRLQTSKLNYAKLKMEKSSKKLIASREFIEAKGVDYDDSSDDVDYAESKSRDADRTSDKTAENNILRDLLTAELESGVASTGMTDEQRTRAMLLLERSKRKKDKRVTISKTKRELKDLLSDD